MSDTVRPLVAGNWKMNGSRAMTAALIGGVVKAIGNVVPHCEILVCPPGPFLRDAADAIGDSPVMLGAQDCHAEASGAHTGDVSAPMLADMGCGYVVVGHSERRADHGENDGTVKAKAEAGLAAGLKVIVCVGETLAERDAGRAADVVAVQLEGSLPGGADAVNTVIAYEPVWAIGTGRTPTTADIEEIHAKIRAGLRARLGDEVGDGVRILYGGSVKPENAAEILSVANVNGALVGGASLDADDFWSICQSCP